MDITMTGHTAPVLWILGRFAEETAPSVNLARSLTRSLAHSLARSWDLYHPLSPSPS